MKAIIVGAFFILFIADLGILDYIAIKHIVETWPPQTFLNGAQIFCFIPFLTLGTLAYGGLLWMLITGELNTEER